MSLHPDPVVPAQHSTPESADGEPVRPGLSTLDAVALGLVLLVALLGWTSLGLAHAGVHSGVGAVLITLVVLGAGAALLVRGGLRLRPDVPGLAAAAAAAAVMAALAFPGFSYGVADKDPGGYVTHAAEIARTGDYSFTDPVLSARLDGAPLPVQLASPGARLPGVWLRGPQEDGLVVPQFYHLWPALLATSLDLGGYSALRGLVALMGVLSVVVLVALLRRVGDALFPERTGRWWSPGVVAGLSGGLLLATNMLQVWQTRYPTTEVLAQALYLAALLGIVLAVQTGRRTPAALAGLCVGVGWLNRPDGLLLVLMAAGTGAALVALRRWDARSWWFLAGLAVVTPHALLQAYRLALFYSNANGIPSLPKVVALVAVLFLVAGALRLVLGRSVLEPLQRLLEQRRAQVAVGLAVCAVMAGLLVVGFLRRRLFGIDYFDYNGRNLRSYDEQVLRRLSWFLTLPGFALMGLGLAAVALRRWVASAWVVVLPTLALFPLYAYSARNSSRMLWWSRRYVPTVLPGVVVLIALVLTFAFFSSRRGRAVLAPLAGLSLAGLLAVFLSQSVPLRRHDEWKGSFEASARISALSGEQQGLYLWDTLRTNNATALFATPVWLARGEVSVLLPSLPERRNEVLAQYRQAFPDMPVFVVGAKQTVPVGVDPAVLQPVDDFSLSLPMWDESDAERPRAAHRVPVSVSVWRVQGT
ncbi:MAG: hypothetical protein JWO60_965 [Frankiales bacterium]|nr:hypothetical protein [Frankiales bacterium]